MNGIGFGVVISLNKLIFYRIMLQIFLCNTLRFRSSFT